MIAKFTRMLLTIALLPGVVSVYTQAEIVPFLKVSIPFNFTVENQILPAGGYTISDSDLHPQSVIWLQSTDGKHIAAVHTHPRYALAPSVRTQLIFQHSGGEYFLSQVWTLGSSSGREVPLSNRAGELATNDSGTDVATIVADASFRTDNLSRSQLGRARPAPYFRAGCSRAGHLNPPHRAGPDYRCNG